VILLLSLLAGGILGYVCGGSITGLQHLRLRGELVLVGLLLMQGLLPVVLASGVTGRALYWVWALTFPVMAAICAANRKVPGMALATAGLALNAAVILLNHGMPVGPEAVSAAGGSLESLKAMDFAHNAANARTIFPALADVLPIPGAAWMRGAASPGDVVLSCGVAVCLSNAMVRYSRIATTPRAGTHAPAQK
jgi:hypothetical protein